MNRKIHAILAVLVLALQLSGCTALTGETLGQNVDDTTVTTSVKSKLALEKVSSLTSDRDCRESGDERSGRVNRS